MERGWWYPKFSLFTTTSSSQMTRNLFKEKKKEREGGTVEWALETKPVLNADIISMSSVIVIVVVVAVVFST